MPPARPVPAAWPAPQRICVLRALQLGDMICAGPALRALRRRFPGARITLVGLPWAADFAARMAECIDEFIVLPGWPGLPEQEVDLARLPGFLRRMQASRFDLAVQLHGSGRLTNRLVRAFGAAQVLAHRPGRAHALEPDGGGYWPYPEHLHEVHRNLQLVQKLGPAEDDDRVSFPLRAADHDELRQRRPDLAQLPGQAYVCLHPGARAPAKWWPAAGFAELGDALAGLGWRIVLTGSAHEHPLAARVASLMHAPAIHAACDISIGALAVLLSKARLLVCNDTGVAHVAAGLDLPSVVLFLATEPRRWGPLDPSRHLVLKGAPTLAPRQVIEAACRLAGTPGPAG